MAPTPSIRVVSGSVRKLCQLTGEEDRERRQPAFNRTFSRFGVWGTDLGSSFEHAGRLWFLFGDTWPGPGMGQDTDSVAFATGVTEQGIALQFLTGADGRYRPPRLIGPQGQPLGTGSFNVPIAGFSTGEKMYVFHSTDSFVERGGPGGLDAFWQGPDGALGSSWANPGVDGGRWRPAFPATPPGAARHGSPLAAVVRFGDALDLFWIGADGAVGTTWANPRIDGAAWHTPFPVTPPGAARGDSPLAALTRLQGALDAFWIGPDGAIGSTWANPQIDQGRWHAPFPITPPGAARAGSPLAAVTRLEGALDAFWIGPDGAVATTWANPQVDQGRWHPPFPVTPPGAARADSPLAAVTRLSGALDLFWIGPDGAIASTWANPQVDQGRWHPPFPITPPGAARPGSPLAAVTRLAGALDAFWIGADGAVGTTWANPALDQGRWHAPFAATPPGAAAAGSPLCALTRLQGALDLLWVGADGAVATCWANPQVDQGRWHAPFPITQPLASAGRGAAFVTRSNGGERTLMGRTVLARAEGGDPTRLAALYDVSRLDQDGRFINVAVQVLPQGLDSLPFGGPALVAFGSGRYRDSPVHLGAVPLNQVESVGAWRYLAHWTAVGAPIWSTQQRDAAPLFAAHDVGELSATRLPSMGLWLLLFNAGVPRGIHARVAAKPWGPWSDPVVVFDPGWPGLGYGHFMHRKDVDDGLSDPGRGGEWGGEYGPYVVERCTRALAVPPGAPARVEIRFLLSTWNPYNTVLMTAALERAG